MATLSQKMYLEKVQRSANQEFKYSIIIPTWNNLAYLKLVIRSIQENSKFNHQIIVHINEGSDGSYEWIKQQAEIDYVYSKENIGICYALNSCRSLMKTQYLVYVNDDMYVLPDWDFFFNAEIEQLNSKDFFISCTLIEPTFANNCTIVANFGQDIAQFREQDLLASYKTFTKEDWAGSTWPINIVHVDWWDRVGGYSVEFSPGMYSDPDFSKKLWDAGIRYFKGLAASRAYHFGSKSTKRSKNNKGHQMFLLKWGMTSKTFTTLYLKRGEKFKGELSEPDLNPLILILNKIKYIIAACRK
jgi:glycosyltransferase involved in cell wall biosynthesis